LRIFLYFIGKPRDRHANAMAEEYIKRTSRFVKCEMREIHPERFDPWKKHQAASKLLLDPAGRAMDSATFTRRMEKAENEGCDVVFVVGGAEGLPEHWKRRAGLLLALSPLTLPHELARVVLAEQIYRAFTTLRGHPYAR
jgi:23S rRNA (pseudouridine1915-N3)-methyltransferase